jgi:hypothetical protein
LHWLAPPLPALVEPPPAPVVAAHADFAALSNAVARMGELVEFTHGVMQVLANALLDLNASLRRGRSRSPRRRRRSPSRHRRDARSSDSRGRDRAR